jgi:hypothetical protein
MGRKNIYSLPVLSADENTGVGVPSQSPRPRKTPCILVVTRHGHMGEPVMNYAVNVAERLKYGIFAVHVNTLPFFCDGGRRNRLFASAMEESAAQLMEMARAKGVLVEHLGESGKIGRVVKRLCHSARHIEFVIVDQGIGKEEVASQSPVPVFSVIYTSAKPGQIHTATHHTTIKKGVSGMSTTSRKRHMKNCFVFGALTVGLYAAVFSSQSVVMTYFTKGGLYALLPVALVFAVSYVHGNFTSAFWSALGIEGSKATVNKEVEVRKEAPATADIRKDTRPRAQVSV